MLSGICTTVSRMLWVTSYQLFLCIRKVITKVIEQCREYRKQSQEGNRMETRVDDNMLY